MKLLALSKFKIQPSYTKGAILILEFFYRFNATMSGDAIDRESSCLLQVIYQWLHDQASQLRTARCRTTHQGIDVFFTI